MTLENIYYIGQTLAVIVIIATLIALLIQTRQTNALARAETSRATMLQLTSGQYSLFETPEKAAFLYKAMRTSKKLTAEEKERFGFTLSLVFGNAEIAFNMDQTGLMGGTDLNRGADTLRGVYLSSPRVRKWWSNARMFYAKNSDFLTFIDKLSAEAEAATRKSAGPVEEPDV